MQDAFHTIHTHATTQLHDELNTMNALVNEAYSSGESNNPQSLDHLNGNTIYEETGVLLEQYAFSPEHTATFADASRHYASLSRRKKERLESSMQRVHHRSRSAGNDALFTVIQAPSTSGLKGLTNGTESARATHRKNSNNSSGSLSALKATKKFFKKIYDSATLPGRSHAKASTSDVQIESAAIIPSRPFFEIRYSSDLDDEDRYNSELGFGQFPSLMQCTDHDSTPSTLKSTTDDPMNDSLLTKSISSSDSQKTSSGEFHSWAEVFDHLKREMKYMRERDAQILADLQMVETQLQNVKNRTMGTSKSDYALMVDRDALKLGDLVDSMPL
ncbi:hypothetical protein Tcan_13893 [Toxocara canis]|uniref:Uncharacterized protein n=1 Tax=Toxocara canis TaxID=6265 RepID=A0A0B2UWI1_TOXCA|nr:hypothetical protein Tcan_13893 [Toxocara canis]